MTQLAHLGIEYSDTGLRVAVLVGGRLERIALPAIDNQVLLDTGNGIGSLGVSFPGLFRIIGAPGSSGGVDFLERIFKSIRNVVERGFKKQIGRTVIAVPTGLMSMRRSTLVSSAAAAGLKNVDLVDISIPPAIAYSATTDAPTTQLSYYCGYGECEFALLRVAPRRVKVLASGIARSVSGQLFDAHLIEAIVLALRERNVFLGLKGFRSKQWLEFRRIAAKARDDLDKKPEVDVTLPPTLVGAGRTVRVTLSTLGWAARMAPTVKTTLDDVVALLEQNEIQSSELDAVIAVGDTATKDPMLAMLAQAFPGKVRVGEIGVIAAAAATYSAWLEPLSADEVQFDKQLSYYLSPYAARPVSPIEAPDGKAVGPQVVSDIAVEEMIATGGPARAGETNPFAPARDAPAMDTPLSSADDESVNKVAAAKELIERGRSLIEEAGRLLQNLDSPEEASDPIDDQSHERGTAQLFMTQADDFLSRGRYLEAVALAHRAYQEANLDATIFAGMLRVHVSAAMAMDKPEQYSDAIQTLMCAHSHDQTDKSVHQALAARHYQQAQAMEKQDPKSAMVAVNEALRFDPKHQHALAMFEILAKASASNVE
jgi:actin-like ATPase involved in cell morphogenesis